MHFLEEKEEHAGPPAATQPTYLLPSLNLHPLILAVKFPGTSSAPHHPVRSQSDSAVISAASSAAANGLECPPTLQEQPQAAVIPQGKEEGKRTFIKVDLLLLICAETAGKDNKN